MITMDKKYRTRDGRAVRVWCVDRNQPIWPVVVLVEENNEGGLPHTCTAKGYFHSDESPHYLDLIEVKTKIVLKSIKQLMEEYPEWYFDKDGDFIFKDNNRVLTTDLYLFTGSQTSEFCWPEVFCTEIEE